MLIYRMFIKVINLFNLKKNWKVLKTIIEKMIVLISISTSVKILKGRVGYSD